MYTMRDVVPVKMLTHPRKPTADKTHVGKAYFWPLIPAPMEGRICVLITSRRKEKHFLNACCSRL